MVSTSIHRAFPSKALYTIKLVMVTQVNVETLARRMRIEMICGASVLIEGDGREMGLMYRMPTYMAMYNIEMKVAKAGDMRGASVRRVSLGSIAGS